MSDIATLLGDLGLDQYEHVFADNGVDLRALPYLTDQDTTRKMVSGKNSWGTWWYQ